jgi:hypothetical protein
MKRTLCLVTLVLVAGSSFAQEAATQSDVVAPIATDSLATIPTLGYSDSYDLGVAAAERSPINPTWLFCGVAGGFFVPPVGGLIVTFTAPSQKSPPPPSQVNQAAYRKGYERHPRTRNRRMAGIGAILSTVIVVAYFANNPDIAGELDLELPMHSSPSDLRIPSHSGQFHTNR